METSYIVVTSKEGKKVFEIKDDGSVGYMVNGKYRIADTDKKLGVALGQALIEVTNLIKQYK